MNRDIANAIAGTELVRVQGTFFRHAWVGAKELRGSTGGGRWGPENGFPVLYLGQPLPSVVAEAHRRLVDGVDGMRPELVGPRSLFEVEVDVSNVLDLQPKENRAAVGLDTEALVGPWGPCTRVARAAHQLGLHGILAPAATGLGVTLAIFEAHLPAAEWPLVREVSRWEQLPSDPRSDVERDRQLARLHGTYGG